MASKLKCSITESECKNSKNGKRADIDELARRCGIPNPESYSNREKLCAAIVAKYRETGGGSLSVPAPVSPASSIARSVTSTTSTTELPDDIREYILPPFKKTGDPTIEKLKKVADAVISQYNLEVRKSGTKEEIYRNVKNALDKIKSGKSETSTAPTKDFFDDLLGTKATIAVKPSTKILSKSEEEEEELKRQLAQKQKARKEREEKEKAEREKAARDAALAKDRQKKEEKEREKARMLKEQEELKKKAMIEEAANRTQVVRQKQAEAKKTDIEEKPPTSVGKGLDVAIKKSYSVEGKDFTTIVFEIIDDLGSYSEILNNYKDESGGDISFSKLRPDLTKVITNNKYLESFKKGYLITKIKNDIINYLQEKKVREEKVLEVVEPINPLTQKIAELVNENYSELSGDNIITNIIQKLKEYVKDPNLLKGFFDKIVETNVTTNTITFDNDLVDEIIEQQLVNKEETPQLIPVLVATEEEVPMLEPARRLKSPLNRRQKFIKGAILSSSGDNCYPDYNLDCPGDLVCDIDNNPPKCIDRSLANLKQKNIEGIDEYNLRGKRIIGNKDTINTLKTILKSDLSEKDYKHDTYDIIDNLIKVNIENNILDKGTISNNVFTSLESTGEFTPEQLVSNKLKYYVKRMINLLVSEKKVGGVVVSEAAPIVDDINIDSIIQKYKEYTSENVILKKVKKDLNELGLVVSDEILKEKIQDMLDVKDAEEEEEAEEEVEEEEEVLPIPNILQTISTKEIIEGNMLSTLLDKTDDESSDRQRQIRLAQNAVIKCLGLA